MQTQDSSKALQEFATVIEQLIHHAYPALLDKHICKEPGKAVGNGIESQGVKQQLLFEGSNTLSEALKQALGLQVVRFSSGSGKRMMVNCGGASPLPNKKGCTDSISASSAGPPVTSGSSVPTYQKQNWHHAYGLLKMSSLKEGAV
jgi:hypothetical protein